MADKGSGVLESTGLTYLFYFTAYGEHPDIGFLGPTHDIVVHDLKTTYFSLTFREVEGLLYLTCQTKHIESVVSCNDEGFL